MVCGIQDGVTGVKIRYKSITRLTEFRALRKAPAWVNYLEKRKALERYFDRVALPTMYFNSNQEFVLWDE